MVIVDSVILDDSVSDYLNDQDVVVTINNTTLNLEMSSNIYSNKRKNERTAFKYAGNQYKVGSSYDDVYIFYQICIEIAKKMLADKVDSEIIIKYTGLTIEEIRNITL